MKLELVKIEKTDKKPSFRTYHATVFFRTNDTIPSAHGPQLDALDKAAVGHYSEILKAIAEVVDADRAEGWSKELNPYAIQIKLELEGGSVSSSTWLSELQFEKAGISREWRDHYDAQMDKE